MIVVVYYDNNYSIMIAVIDKLVIRKFKLINIMVNNHYDSSISK